MQNPRFTCLDAVPKVWIVAYAKRRLVGHRGGPEGDPAGVDASDGLPEAGVEALAVDVGGGDAQFLLRMRVG